MFNNRLLRWQGKRHFGSKDSKWAGSPSATSISREEATNEAVYSEQKKIIRWMLENEVLILPKQRSSKRSKTSKMTP